MVIERVNITEYKLNKRRGGKVKIPTFSTLDKRITNVTSKTNAYRHMVGRLAFSVNAARLTNSTRVTTLEVEASQVIGTFFILATFWSRRWRWRWWSWRRNYRNAGL